MITLLNNITILILVFLSATYAVLLVMVRRDILRTKKELLHAILSVKEPLNAGSCTDNSNSIGNFVKK